MQLHFDRVPAATELRDTIQAHISDADYFNDVHGSAAYKRQLVEVYVRRALLSVWGGEAKGDET